MRQTRHREVHRLDDEGQQHRHLEYRGQDSIPVDDARRKSAVELGLLGLEVPAEMKGKDLRG